MVADPDAVGRVLRNMGLRAAPNDLLLQAFVHSSFINESGGAEQESNQRLEFLGDAVLGFVVGDYLFRRFTDVSEGALTELRAALVRGTTLAEIANRHGVGDALILGKGEESRGGRERSRNLAGALEAIIGAVYVSAGMTRARTFILRLLKPEMAVLEDQGLLLDAKSRLQHMVQARWHNPPRYQTLSEGDPDSEHRFAVAVFAGERKLAEGSGRSKRRAQQNAALKALELLTDGFRQDEGA